MDTKTAIFYLAIIVVVALFMILFLQAAFVRYRLRDVETSMRAVLPDGADDHQGNGVRAYALRLASCRMNELNARAQRPLIPRDLEFYSTCRRSASSSSRVNELTAAAWLVMRRSTMSEQLRRDVETRRVKYLIISGRVVQVAAVDVSLQLGAHEAGALDYTYLLMVDPFEVAADPLCAVSDVILPWMTPGASSYVSDTQSQSQDIVQMVRAKDKCTAESDLVLHVWAYGTSRKSS